MPKSTLAGHSLQPILIVALAALIPFGFILDAMHRSTGKESYANAAYYSMVGGLLGGVAVAAAAAGAMDYLAIEAETEVKRTANQHAALNSGVQALTAANVLARRRQPKHRGGSIVTSMLAAIVLLVSGFCGRMVHEQGMRVRGVSPVEPASEHKLPGDERPERAMLEAEKYMPSRGPMLY